MTTPPRLLAVGVTALLITVSAHAQNYAVLNKEQRFVQTGAATVVADAQGAGFNAQVDSTSATLAPSFTLPGGAVRALTYSASEERWRLEQRFANRAALDAAFPNGTYTLTISGRTASLPITGDIYPNAPVATLSQGTFANNVLTIDGAQPLTITTSFTQNYLATRSRLAIYVSGGGGGNPFIDLGANNEATNFTQTPVSFTVPANTFAAGVTYTIELEANRIVTLDTTSLPGYVAVGIYTSFTTITVSTGGAPTAPPTFVAQPVPQNVAPGNAVVFSAAANNATNYQWRFNGAPMGGATGPTLVLTGPAVVAGRYSVFASNAVGGTASNEAVLTVSNTTDVGRLINLSILTPLTAGESMTMGTVLGGQGTSGTKPLLVRAAGPALAQLGVTGFLADPAMTLVNTSSNTTVGSNAGWGGSAALAEAFASVGAFGYASPTSRDSAMFQPTLAAANYTVQVRSNAGNASGTVIAELYDATPSASFGATTPRLINVSVLKQIASGTSLTAGFVVGGSTAKTVLVRAIGPRLGLDPFKIAGAMPAPTMTLVNTSTNTTMARNTGWGGDPQILNVANSVGAFAVTDPASRDAMLLLTLSPGNYTAQVSPATGTAGGTAIVEVYEVP